LTAHHGHIASDGREHAIEFLAPLNAPEFEPWTLVDAAWTSKPAAAANRANTIIS